MTQKPIYLSVQAPHMVDVKCLVNSVSHHLVRLIQWVDSVTHT